MLREPHGTNDVAESLKDEDRGHQVILLQFVEGLDTESHEGLSLFLPSRGEVFQHGEEELLGIVHSFRPLDHQPGGGGGREGRGSVLSQRLMVEVCTCASHL